MLGDHGIDQKGPLPYRQHLEVPLRVANHPGIAAGTRSDAPAGTIYLPGTALDVAGDRVPLGQSRSLLGPASNADSPWRSVNFSELGDALKLVEDADFRFCGYPFTDDLFLYRPADDPERTRRFANHGVHGVGSITLWFGDQGSGVSSSSRNMHGGHGGRPASGRGGVIRERFGFDAG